MRCSRSMNVPRDCFSDIAAVDALLRRFVRKKRMFSSLASRLSAASAWLRGSRQLGAGGAAVRRSRSIVGTGAHRSIDSATIPLPVPGEQLNRRVNLRAK
jgi:hypothetical protein